MPVLPPLLYLFFCVICGLAGRRTSVGFLGHFLLALVLTPLGDLAIQVLGRPCPPPRARAEKKKSKLRPVS